MTLTEQIAHLRSLLDKCPGQWRNDNGLVMLDGHCLFESITGDDGVNEDDIAKLMVSMRNSLPSILDRLERMEADRNTARASLLLIWPDGEKCQHQHARAAFEALK